MHGLINRAVQCFVRDTHGDDVWKAVARRAALNEPEFEAMLHYDDAITGQVISAAAVELGRPQSVVLEDIGTYLVSHPNVEALRRLLRFSGVTFLEFLYSLDDLNARAGMALSDLEVPDLELLDFGEGVFSLKCRHDRPGFSYVAMGMLRTMADDYGALVYLEHEETAQENGLIHIQLFEESFSDGRDFALGVKTA